MRGCIFGDPGTHRPPLLLVIFVLEFWFFFCLQFQGCLCVAVFIGDPDTHRLAPRLFFWGALVMFVSAVFGGWLCGCICW